MHGISYNAALVPVRDDFAATHSRFWKRLASPGAWWTGAERVAIAAEVRHARHCALCQARKAVLTPAAVAGQHDHRHCASVFIEPVPTRICSGRAASTVARRLTWPP
jgi:hypothetical protein